MTPVVVTNTGVITGETAAGLVETGFDPNDETSDDHGTVRIGAHRLPHVRSGIRVSANHEPHVKTSHGISPSDKFLAGMTTKEPAVIDDVIADFRKHHDDDEFKIVGDITRGVSAVSTDPKSPAISSLRSRAFIPKAITLSDNPGHYFDLAREDKEAFTTQDVARYLSETLLIGDLTGRSFVLYGNLQHGLNVFLAGSDHPLFVFSAEPDAPYRVSGFVFVQGGEDIHIKNPKFGGAQGKQHIEHTQLVKPNAESERHVQAWAQAIMVKGGLAEVKKDANALGFDRDGFERECWVFNPRTKSLMRVYSIELLAGCVEVDDGNYTSLFQAAKGLAASRLQLESEYPGLPINTTSVPFAGSPYDTRVNFFNPAVGKYNMVLDPWDAWKIRNRPKDPRTLQVIEAIAQRHGYENAQELLQAFPDTRLWNTGAAHRHMGVLVYRDHKGRWKVDGDLSNNISLALDTKLGAITEMLCASSPYDSDAVIKVDGHVTRDSRFYMRNLMETALPYNVLNDSAATGKEAAAEVMSLGKDGSNTIKRAWYTHKLPDGSRRYIAHGVSRNRATDDSKAQATHENTSNGASMIRARLQADAIDRYLKAIALLARANHQDTATFIAEKTGLDPKTLIDGREEVIHEFMTQGTKSQAVQDYLAMMHRIFSAFDIPEFSDERDIGLAVFANQGRGVADGSFTDLAQGRGTLGGALVPFATSGMDSFTAVQWVHAFESQEAPFIKRASHRQLMAYLTGQGGFRFIPPN